MRIIWGKISDVCPSMGEMHFSWLSRKDGFSLTRHQSCYVVLGKILCACARKLLLSWKPCEMSYTKVCGVRLIVRRPVSPKAR